MPSNAFWIVSVRTNVPLTIATPITTANAVSSARTLRPGEALQRDGDHRRGHRLQRLEDLVRARAAEVADDVAVGEEQHAVGDRRGVRVVRDHHGRLAERVDRVAQQREDLAAGGRVQVARRLVGEHHASGATRARGRPRRAAAGRRRAPTGGA